ncbi:MAG TPA: ornithine cyclodeaminase family protein [Usitatibacter sp.]|nr:ornithine cyclodeaminase family protein [Usitatibacter sp.]
MTLQLSGADVERLLTPDACIAAVEHAFREHALGHIPTPGILGMHAPSGSFHVKAGFITTDRAYFAAKINANFPANVSAGLPTIQGAIVLFDASNGEVLAIMDSIAITALRTAAASAIAAKHLARSRCETLLLCGCGGQGAAQLRSMLAVREPARILVFDQDVDRAQRFASSMGAGLGKEIVVARDLATAVTASDLIITCTTARRFFITREMVRPGTFIAAVGADNEEKQEIDPQLMAAAKVVTDLTDQAARIGDLHHAIDAGVMSAADVHAQLGELIAGLKRGRENDDEVTVFDSTGTGLQDVAAAVAVYRSAIS